MIKKRCASIFDLWSNFEVKEYCKNIGLFILGVTLLPFVYIFVKINNAIYILKK